MISPRTHGARDWWWHSYYVFTAPRSHNWDQRQNQPCVPTVKTSTRWEREGLWEWGDVKMDVMCGFHHPNPRFWVNSPHLQHASSSTIDLQSDINSRMLCIQICFSGVIFLQIWGSSGFQHCLCSLEVCICTVLDPKDCWMLYAILLLHFISFCLTNISLPGPKWYKKVQCRSA